MKKFLFICLLLCFACDEVADSVNCLLGITGYKEAVQEVLKAIETRDARKIITVTTKVLNDYKDQVIDCMNKITNIKGLVCKHPIKTVQCLIDCGLPDSSPRYCKCYTACRNEYCL